MDRDRPDGLPDGRAAPRQRPRPRRLQPHPVEGGTPRRAGRRRGRLAEGPRRSGHRLHDGLGQRRPRPGHDGRRGSPERLRPPSPHPGGLLDRLAGGVRQGARRRDGCRHRFSCRPGERQREGGQGGATEPRRLRPAGSLRRGGTVSGSPRPGRELRRRRRARTDGEDLPQRLPRRRRAVARGDHGARREGGGPAPRLPRFHQQERDGIDLHPLQGARVRQSRLHADLHPGAPAQGPRSGPRRGSQARGPDAPRRPHPGGLAEPLGNGCRLRLRRAARSRRRVATADPARERGGERRTRDEGA